MVISGKLIYLQSNENLTMREKVLELVNHLNEHGLEVTYKRDNDLGCIYVDLNMGGRSHFRLYFDGHLNRNGVSSFINLQNDFDTILYDVAVEFECYMEAPYSKLLNPKWVDYILNVHQLDGSGYNIEEYIL